MRPSWRLSGGGARLSGKGFAGCWAPGGIGNGEDSDPSQQQLADASLQIGGPARPKLPNLKTVKGIVGDLCVALSVSLTSISLLTKLFCGLLKSLSDVGK